MMAAGQYMVCIQALRMTLTIHIGLRGDCRSAASTALYNISGILYANDMLTLTAKEPTANAPGLCSI